MNVNFSLKNCAPWKKSFFLFSACLLLLNLLLPGQGEGHTYLDHSSPADGAEVEEEIKTITLRFNSTVKELLQLQIVSRQGEKVEPLQVTGGGKQEITVTLAEPLPKGEYDVNWQIVSEDGHLVDGAISFVVSWQPPEEETPSPSESEGENFTGNVTPGNPSLANEGTTPSPPENGTGQEREGDEEEPSPEAQEAAYKFYATSLLWLFIGALVALVIIIIAIKRRN